MAAVGALAVFLGLSATAAALFWGGGGGCGSGVGTGEGAVGQDPGKQAGPSQAGSST